MKDKLTLTIEEDLIPASKEFASAHGMSLSSLVESLLREAVSGEHGSFAARWRGRFKVSDGSGPRYKRLKRRYLS